MRSVRKAFAPFLFLLLGCTASASQTSATAFCDSLMNGRADLLYVCADSVKDEVRRLAAHRKTYQNYTSIVAPVESLQACGFGTNRQAAIRALVARSLTAWPSPPTHLILVGPFASDTSAYIVPSWHLPDQAIGFWTPTVPTDDPYAFMPGTIDSVPAISVGRIPLQYRSEIRAYVDKVISYEQQGPTAWKAYALHVIEDRDLEGNSGLLSRTYADSLAQEYAGREANFIRSFVYGRIPPYQINSPWNAGLGFALFWGTAGYWNQYAMMFGRGCASPSPSGGGYVGDTLQVNYKTPVVLAMTCGNGYTAYDHDANPIYNLAPYCRTLAQYYLGVNGKGAVSVSGPSRSIHEIPAFAIAREWYQVTFGPGGPIYVEPGRVLREVKLRLMPTLPAYHSEILSMVALGDPAVQFVVGSDPVVGVGDPAPVRDFVVRALASPSRELGCRLSAPQAGTYEVEVYDVRGRRVAHKSLVVAAPSQEIIARFERVGLRPGIYFIAAHSGSMVGTTKVVLLR